MITKEPSYFIFAVVLTTIIGYLCIHSNSKILFSTTPPLAFSKKESTFTPISNISFTLARLNYDPIEYFLPNYNKGLTYEHLSGYIGIVEPHSKMSLYIIEDDSKATTYSYTICQISTERSCEEGSSTDDFLFKCSPEDEHAYEITIQGYDKSSNLVSQGNGFARCSYVRREIRDLSEDDLDDFLDAMHVLWKVSDEVGQEIYGADYLSAKRLTSSHYFNAAWGDADHIHEGNGFLIQHIKLTNLFEKAVQTVDPSVALPYWDFTQDNAAHKSFDVDDSFVFSERVFGNITQATNPKNGFTYSEDPMIGARITNGRWANLTADLNEDYPDLHFGYGYMRAPWNMNPSPYVSRFVNDIVSGLPSCSSHYSILREVDLMTFFYQISFASHGSTHGVLGGFYGCDKLKTVLDLGHLKSVEDMNKVCSNWVNMIKENYRGDNIVPLSGCSVSSDIQSSECGFECRSLDRESIRSRLQTKFADNAKSDMTDEDWDQWVDFLCDGDGDKIFAGDHLESASPADPSFWPIHPTLERLLQAKLMSGGFQNEAWATDANDACDKHRCYIEGKQAYYKECCDGHYADSRLLDYIKGDRCSYIGDTNEETLAATDPRLASYSMSYVYDRFDWSHCSEDFLGLLNPESQSQTQSLSSSEDSTEIEEEEEKDDKEEEEKEEEEEEEEKEKEQVEEKEEKDEKDDDKDEDDDDDKDDEEEEDEVKKKESARTFTSKSSSSTTSTSSKSKKLSSTSSSSSSTTRHLRLSSPSTSSSSSSLSPRERGLKSKEKEEEEEEEDESNDDEDEEEEEEDEGKHSSKQTESESTSLDPPSPSPSFMPSLGVNDKPTHQPSVLAPSPSLVSPTSSTLVDDLSSYCLARPAPSYAPSLSPSSPLSLAPSPRPSIEETRTRPPSPQPTEEQAEPTHRPSHLIETSQPSEETSDTESAEVFSSSSSRRSPKPTFVTKEKSKTR